MKMTKILVLAGMFIFALGCKGHKKVVTKPVSAIKKQETQKKKVASIEKKAAPTVKKATEAPKATEMKKTAPPADISSKENLEKCYLEIYCAQKNGNMAGLLKIYKKYGFDTPKKWTKAYIEAAKDTDWVSELARKASKACKKTK